jgi:parallel beta-helix repeat protein
MQVRRFTSLAVLLFFALGATIAASATTRYVSTHGNDSGDCSSTPCLTIGYAVAKANPGDTLKVAAGTYPETVTIAKQLALVGGNDMDSGDDNDHDSHARNAVLDAHGFDNGFVINGAASAGTSLRGFTILNAGKEGIFADLTSNLTIAGNRLLNNDAYGPFSPQCPAADPDDCGEALHLQSVTNSVVTGNLVKNNVGGILLTDEDGPTSGNVISNNHVIKNTKDCGITLASHYFQLGSPVTADKGGIYDNQVLNNVSDDNGAAGIGVFAGPPGAAAYRNIVVGNTARGNGLPGVAIHSHTPFQYVNDNVIAYNYLSNNGPDDDASTVDPTGISVFSAVVPIRHTTIVHNRISSEHYGIFTVNAVTLQGLDTNVFTKSVAVPISIH